MSCTISNAFWNVDEKLNREIKLRERKKHQKHTHNNQ